MTPPASNSSVPDLVDIKVDLAVVQRDVEKLEESVGEIKHSMASAKDLNELKEEVKGIKTWVMRAVWVVLGAMLLQVTTFMLKGGFNVPPLPRI